jgi:hypothetical protein
LKSTDKSPVYYQYYPRLFYKYFEDIDKKIVETLSEAGYYYYQATLLTDSIVDNKRFASFPLISILQEEAVKILISVFGINSEFWKYWDRRKQAFIGAVKIEKQLQAQKKVNWEAYKNLADKKSTFGKIAIDCLYQLSDKKNENLYRLLLHSHYYFSVGFQLYDDIKDFKEDFEQGQFNWAIYELKQKVDFNRYKNNLSILNKLLYTQGVASAILNKSIAAFQKAEDMLSPLNIDSEWLGVIRDMKNTISNYADITLGYIKVVETKAKLYKKRIITDRFFSLDAIDNPSLQSGLNYIKADYLRNYAEMKHVMYLSRNDDFDNENPLHVTDIFQRALLNDCLLSIAKNQHIDIANYLNYEIRYLTKYINKDAIGAWSYFPSVKEIAADIDDLGQIMQLFIHAKKANFLIRYCAKPIDTALANRYNKEGGIATWLIPNENRTPVQEKQDLCNRTKWGTGPDVEVVANFAYALYRYQPEKYSAVIEKAIQFICNNQHEKGFWESRWYYGAYYGTYVCLRLLETDKEKYRPSIQKAIGFITENQNKDGGFGWQPDISDALSTSFALLSLKLLGDTADDSVKKAEQYLTGSQQNDGSWIGVDFIKPKVSEPYKSKVLTTAFALKALF